MHSRVARWGRITIILASLAVISAVSIVGNSLPAMADHCDEGEIEVLSPTRGEVCIIDESEEVKGKEDRSKGSQSSENVWVKPKKPGGKEPRSWWEKKNRGWSLEDSYDLPTQDPCFGITDPIAYVECQSIPWLENEDTENPPVVVVTPEQAAQKVIAKLKFTAADPQVGPNRDHHDLPFDTAVGYPLWLWTSGGTTSDSVTESVGPLTVAVSIQLDKVTWKLGDGSTLRCDKGTKWRKGMTPGKRSPTCGHVYKKPGKYTIEATSHWTISWTAGGESGTMPYSITADRPLEVGEIHVLVR